MTTGIIELAMINFKITGFGNVSLVIERPSGKTLSLKLGEVVKAEIMDILPSGGVTLRIKGDFITAKTEMPLREGAVAFFRVTNLPSDGRDLKLQFMGYKTDTSKAESQRSDAFFASNEGRVISKLLHELSSSIMDTKTFNTRVQSINSEILKALPQDINSMPKEIRMRLQNLLQAGLKITGQGIQARLDSLMSQFPEGIKGHPLIQAITNDLMVGIEDLPQIPIKVVLQDTGVVLEAKIRAIAEMFQRTEPSGNPETESRNQTQAAIPTQGKDAAAHETKQPPLQHDMSSIKRDLKAGLLQLREFLAEQDKEGVRTFSGHDLTSAQRQTALSNINGLLRDIETFQLLSKITDSFYTFLPVNWRELMDGEISFKRGHGDAKGFSYSCRINLDLEQFGELTIMVLMYNRGFLVSFAAESPVLQKTLANNADILQESFNAQGLNIKAITVMDRSNASLEQFERFESSEKTINIKA